MYSCQVLMPVKPMELKQPLATKSVEECDFVYRACGVDASCAAMMGSARRSRAERARLIDVDIVGRDSIVDDRDWGLWLVTVEMQVMMMAGFVCPRPWITLQGVPYYRIHISDG